MAHQKKWQAVIYKHCQQKETCNLGANYTPCNAMCSLIEEERKKKEEDSVENNFDPLLAIYYLFTTWYYVRPQ